MNDHYQNKSTSNDEPSTHGQGFSFHMTQRKLIPQKIYILLINTKILL